MGLVQKLIKRIPSTSSPPPDDLSSEKDHAMPKLAFFKRRIRLKGNSKISIPLGIVLLFPCIVVILILILIIVHPSSPGTIFIPAGAPPAIRKISEEHDKVFVTGCLEPQTNGPRANAALVVLARNSELQGVIQSIKSMERHFNRWFNYPYVFLNDGDFNTTFKETILNYTSSPVEFGKIDPDMWGYPEWANVEVAREGIRKQGDKAIMYGGMESYHHMCRFYSGFFYKHELLLKYDWYWRVEPDIKYFCDLTYDPFIHMERAKKTYGFTIAVKELKETVPNIFRYASAYKRMNNLTSKGLWEMFAQPAEVPKSPLDEDPKYKPPLPEEILSTEAGHGGLPDVDPEAMEGEVYNMCHFWSNFEIARLDWFRGKEYNDFFDMMDRSGGFWMERWGDAPIHSLAAGALLSPKDIHYFRDIGYRHTTIEHCPANAPGNRQLDRPPFLEMTTKDEKKRVEEDEYWETWDSVKENGVGCRCKCDTDIVDVEGKLGSCMAEWPYQHHHTGDTLVNKAAPELLPIESIPKTTHISPTGWIQSPTINSIYHFSILPDTGVTKMPAAYTPSQKGAIAQFVGFTQSKDSAAAKQLKAHGWNVEEAVDAYFQNSASTPGSSGSTSHLNKLFDKYKGAIALIPDRAFWVADNSTKDKSDPDADTVGVEGSMRYLGDLGVKLDEVVLLAVLTELSAPTMGELTRSGFVEGWKQRRANDINAQKAVIRDFRRELPQPEPFRRVYKHTFKLALAPGQKSLPLDVATEYWRLLLQSPSLNWYSPQTALVTQASPWLDWWLDYLETRWKKGVSKDMWEQTGKFVLKTLESGGEDMSWWSEDGAWPGVIDQFVEYVREKRGVQEGKMEE